ncbi:glutamine synthetase domain protein [Rhodococcus sp. MTM3W5.2]|nr:glutamine synthetase domain protein [Rhodococcus sp. MTM3W5.2]
MISNGVTWLRYSSHSRLLLRRKKSNTCSPSASATSSERSISRSAVSRLLGSSL